MRESFTDGIRLAGLLPAGVASVFQWAFLVAADSAQGMSLFVNYVHEGRFRHMAVSCFENHVPGCVFCSRVLVLPILPVASQLGLPRAFS